MDVYFYSEIFHVTFCYPGLGLTRTLCMCVFVVHACVSVSVCLWLNKGRFCISVLSSPFFPSSLTFYCELLGDWQKIPFIYFSPPPPPSIHPPIYLHFANPLLPHVFVSVSPFRYQTCSHCPLFTVPSHPPTQYWWCLGNRVHAHTHTHTLYSQLFIVPTLSFTRCETLALGWMRGRPCLPCQTFDFYRRSLPTCVYAHATIT